MRMRASEEDKRESERGEGGRESGREREWMRERAG